MLLVTEILGIEVEVNREKDTIGTKIIIDVMVEIRVSYDLILLTCCRCQTVLDNHNNNNFRESRSSELQSSKSSPSPLAKPKSQVTSLDWLVSEK